MVESRDELLMEIARVTGLDRMDEGEGGEEEETDNEGDVATPPAAAPPPRRPLLSYQRRSMKKALWRQSRSKKI
jgi:hypothetical protein